MFASWSLPFIIIIVWSPLVIQLARAKFIGDPIRVTTRFQVSDETKPSEFALLPEIMNESFDEALDEKEAKLVRPRPYLNANKQIEFLEGKTPSPPPPTTTRYKTTMKPAISFKPTSTTENQPTHHRTSTAITTTKATSRPIEATLDDPLIIPDNDLVQQAVSSDNYVLYKPTFRPAVMVAEISNVQASAVTSASAEVTTTTSVDEKVFSVTSALNSLSSNSIVNILVVFGLPLVTALLSFMGAGPLAIATIAWVIPIAAVLISPDLRKEF